jgi:hypothetical protein
MSTPISYTLNVTINHVRPRIWRRILVPAGIKLPGLHVVIQIAMGASNPLQHFFVGGQKTVYANPAWRNLQKIKSGRNVRLEKLLSRPGDRLAYYCGDDDDWEHTVELLKITETPGRIGRAVCLAGSRRCPGRLECHEGEFLLPAVNSELQRLLPDSLGCSRGTRHG